MTKWLLVFLVPSLDIRGEILNDHKMDCINSVPQLEYALKIKFRQFRGKELGQFAHVACVPEYQWESD